MDARLAAMVDVVRGVRHPNGRIPLVGDGDSGRVLPEGFDRPPSHDPVVWTAAAILGGPRPLPGEVPAEVAWTLGVDAWTSMATRPLGGARNAFRSARAHNVPVVDGAEPNPINRRTVFSLLGRAKPWLGGPVEDVDVLVVHDVYLLPLARLLSRSLRLPYLYDAHEDYAAMESDRLPRWWLKVATGLETRIARRAAAVVVPGRTRADRWVSSRLPAPVILRNRGGGAVPTPLADRPADWDLVDDASALLARSRAAFYGLDRGHPYASKACPNTLFDALRAGRPLTFFCGGEPQELLARFRIGILCAPTADAVLEALDDALAGCSWESDAALAAVDREESPRDYVAAVVSAASRGKK